ncbi:MAG: Gfo/Idh/MocA family oxidoreductase [Phycisphaeraceae bacterium]
MTDSTQPTSNTGPTRRQVVAGATAATLAASLPFARVAHAQGSDTIKIALVGCGGRGTGAASQAMHADKGVKLVAMADLFGDHIDNSLRNLNAADVKAQIDPKVQKFVGFDSYKEAINECDVVLLTTTPHFRPMMVEEAVKQKKHMFVEKPVGTDAVNTIKCWEAAKKAKEAGLALVSGLCYRYEKGKQQVIERIQEGAIGEIVAMHTYYYTTFLWHRGRKPEWTEMEYQIRNWLYFTWLSGDHIVEQHIHSYDKCSWAMNNEYPVSAYGTGGRIRRNDPQFGNIYDHFAIHFQYENGVVLHATCRQMDGCENEITDYVVGRNGVANLQGHYIKYNNGKIFRVKRIPGDNMYQNEHDELFKSIRVGKPIYNGDYMCQSTLMGIMGREAAYTGKKITWEALMASKQDLSPKGGYKWGDNEVEPVAIPGITKVV